MTKLLKFFAGLTAMVLIFGGIVGCSEKSPGSGEPPAADEFPSFPLKTEMKEDGQLYRQEGIEFPAALWEKPRAERYGALDRGDIRAYFIDSFGGKQVFCYVGLPEEATQENPVPAVVLVHGALGTAFYDWIRAWNERGYAAIALDTEGRMPTMATSLYNSVYETSIKPHGPVNASFTDCGKPVEEQWVYHALSAVIASTSFIRGFEEVDSSRVGIVGVSYGGFLACLAAGYDDRYVFAASVYGCLSNAEGAGEFGSYIRSNRGAERWDNTGALVASTTPFLFVNSDTDTHFSVDSVTRSANACRYASVSLIPGLLHGHSQGAEVQEVFAFADSFCTGGTPLARIVSGLEDGCLKVALPRGVSVGEAVQIYTVEETLNRDTDWTETAAEIDKNLIFYSAEEYKTHFYIRLRDSRGYYITSLVV